MSFNTDKKIEKEPFDGGYDENGNEVKAEFGMDEEYVKASNVTAADLQANLVNNSIPIQIEIEPGSSLEGAFDELQKRKQDGHVYIAKFNGKTINSNMSLDEIYMTVTGTDKKDFIKRFVLLVEDKCTKNIQEMLDEYEIEEEYVKASNVTAADLQANLAKNSIQIEIELNGGCSLEQAFDEFQQRKQDGRVYIAKFNGKTINSNMSLDEIYMTVNGLNQDDFDIETAMEKYEHERELANRRIINLFTIQKYLNYDLTDEQKVIFRKMYPKISNSVESIYGGQEVVFVLKMLIALKNHDLTYVQNKIEKENFSGAAYNYVIQALKLFGVEI